MSFGHVEVFEYEDGAIALVVDKEYTILTPDQARSLGAKLIKHAAAVESRV